MLAPVKARSTPPEQSADVRSDLSGETNWRITFDVEGETVTNLDLEDYH